MKVCRHIMYLLAFRLALGKLIVQRSSLSDGDEESNQSNVDVHGIASVAYSLGKKVHHHLEREARLLNFCSQLAQQSSMKRWQDFTLYGTLGGGRIHSQALGKMMKLPQPQHMRERESVCVCLVGELPQSPQISQSQRAQNELENLENLLFLGIMKGGSQFKRFKKIGSCLDFF